MKTRFIAGKIIKSVMDGVSLAESLPTQLEKITDPRDRALVQALCFGVCRYYDRLDITLSHLLKNPMREKDSDVAALLMVGLYQLMEMRIPEHAAVSETVNATQKLKKPWARGLVNGILREYLRQKDKLQKTIEQDEEALYSHSRWWIDKVKQAYPSQWSEILTANNAHPPFSLRVNAANKTRDQYLEAISDATTVIAETASGFILDKPVAAEDLPGFKQGDVSVQDGAAQLAAELLQVENGQHVLDACAAPGGKLLHMLELAEDVSVVAVEKEQSRLVQIKENLHRVMPEREVAIHCADASDVSTWWDGKPFDRILLDAPCSASGVIRRHPDIKLLRQSGDFTKLSILQYEILSALWQTLKPGGVLLYATCSIFPEENVAVVKRFLDAHADASERKIDASWGVVCEIGRQILPGMHTMDGFYYARLVRS